MSQWCLYATEPKRHYHHDTRRQAEAYAANNPGFIITRGCYMYPDPVPLGRLSDAEYGQLEAELVVMDTQRKELRKEAAQLDKEVEELSKRLGPARATRHATKLKSVIYAYIGHNFAKPPFYGEKVKITRHYISKGRPAVWIEWKGKTHAFWATDLAIDEPPQISLNRGLTRIMAGL